MKLGKFPLYLNTVKLFGQKEGGGGGKYNDIYLHSTFIYQNLKIANKRRNHIKYTPTS